MYALTVHLYVLAVHPTTPLHSSPPQAGDLIVESLVSVTNPRRRQHFKNALRQLGVLDPVARRGEMRGETGQGGAGGGEGRGCRNSGRGWRKGEMLPNMAAYCNVSCIFLYVCSNESHYCY